MQLQLTISDLVAEVHDTHHPISSAQYYEEQRDAAKLRAAAFRDARMPKFLGYFDRVLQRSGGPWLLGDACCHADLSLLQALLGLEYAFPRAFARHGRRVPALLRLRDRVAGRPRIAAYLASPRRQAFNEYGIFRRYPELDAA
jgi:glutathione S-transferase